MRQGTLYAPRGSLYKIIRHYRKKDLPIPEIKWNLVNAPMSTKVEFHGEDRDYQIDVINRIKTKKTALIKAATGAGKTSMAIRLIAEHQQKTLVIVPGKDLLEQWRGAIAFFLGLNKKDIGHVGGGKVNVKDITVGTYHTVVKNLKTLNQFGMVIADEAHLCSPKGQYEKCIKSLSPQYLYGLTATPVVDGSDVPLDILFGRKIHAPSRKELTRMGKLTDYKVYVHRNNEDYSGVDYNDCLSQLVSCPTRNNDIVSLIKRSLKRPRGDFDGSTLVLFQRIKHIESIAEILDKEGIEYSIVNGAINMKIREQIYSDMRNKKGPRVLLGNQRIVGTGVDLPPLDTLILANPISGDGILQQAIGRILRTAKGKTKPSLVVDIQDGGIFNKGVESRNYFYSEDR